MFHLYCPRCDRAFALPPDTDAIVLLCPACNTRRDLRNGPPIDPPRAPPAPPGAIAASPAEVATPPLLPPTLSMPSPGPTVRGELLAEYPVRPGKVETPMGCGWLLIVAGVGAGVVALIAVYAADASGGMLVLGFVGVVAITIGAALVHTARSNSTYCVKVFDDGFEWTYGKETIRCKWEDVSAVWHRETRYFVNGVYSRTQYYYRVRMTEGREMEFDDTLQNVSRLGETILRETLDRLLPAALERFDRGDEVSFGSLRVSRDGLGRRYYEGKETLPWADVNNIDLNEVSGVITISRKRGKELMWWQTHTSDMPNVLVFLKLVESIVGVSRS